jgi:RNA-binding protein YlmH
MDFPVQFPCRPEEEKFVANFENKIKSVAKRGSIQLTDFYDPFQQGLALLALKREKEIGYAFFGGYEGAERRRVALFPHAVEENGAKSLVDWKIKAIEVTGKSEFKKLSHRDYLGAILALGIKREKIGDLIVNEGACIVFMVEEMCNYVSLQLDKVGNVGVLAREIDLNHISFPEEETERIAASVSSLRLDGILARGFRVSRSKAASHIREGKVKVNYKIVPYPDYVLKEGDRVSLAGYGKMKLDEVGMNTKKGRIRIVIAKYH